ncbi:MAG: helix-turn-helix transcriptional regulator [Candidatus Diapherotrites archaeon]|uniref:Helix-turn-helix transcriptional regulator n=1 Tax=Candidatus Iainarchaeum sp. TaxID=3101447 RepID=A0A8T4LFU5_9ARCH|nr:helix-turn-helix transcriptional regulator [Candidatus Diapherotrites archaeon]
MELGPPQRRMSFRLVIRKVEPPYSDSLLDELDWICKSLGFYEEIDKDKTAAAVFRILVMASERGEALSSTAIADRVNMSRGAVINHLNNLVRSGLIEKHGRFYVARSSSVYRTIEELEDDIDRIFERMKQRARQIDAKFRQRIEQ